MNGVLRDSTELKDLRRQVCERKFENLKEKFKEIPVTANQSSIQSRITDLLDHIKRLFL